MKKMETNNRNYRMITKATEISEDIFPRGSFRVFWNDMEDLEVWFCFKEGIIPVESAYVFTRMFMAFVPELTTLIKFIDPSSDFWKR